VSGKFEDVIRAGAAGLLVLEDPLTYNARRQIADLAAKFRLPTIYVKTAARLSHCAAGTPR